MKTNYSFSYNCTIESEKLFEMFGDFRNISKFFPPLLKNKIIDEKENEAVFEEIIPFKKLGLTVVQRSIHRKIDNSIEISVISGPAKGTIAKILFNKIESGTEIKIILNLSLSFQYRIFQNFIKKKYESNLKKMIDKIIGVATLTSGKTWNSSILDEGDAIVLSVKTFPTFKFYGWWYSELKEMFVEELYKILPVDEQIVVDIGANIGDSAIYFITRGAKQVIAIEPFPINYKMGEKNVRVNELSDKIKFVHGAVSSKSGEISIDSKIEKGYTSFRLREHMGGEKIQTFTLQEIVEQYHIHSGVMKLDCEGCEYDAILTSPNDTLQKFSYVLIEYHKGYEKLREKLLEAGFEISVLDPEKTQGFMLCKNTIR